MLAGFTVVLIVFVVMVRLTIKDGGKESSIDMMLLKIAINHFVITGTATKFPLRWGPTVTAMFDAMRVLSASSAGDGALSLECVSSMAWLDSAVVMAVLPPLIVAVPFATMWQRPALRPSCSPSASWCRCCSCTRR